MRAGFFDGLKLVMKGKMMLSREATNLKLGKYKHYKGDEYEVIGVVINSETLEEMVLYMGLYGQRLMWVRPLKVFLEEIKVKGKKIKRFEFLGR